MDININYRQELDRIYKLPVSEITIEDICIKTGEYDNQTYLLAKSYAYFFKEHLSHIKKRIKLFGWGEAHKALIIAIKRKRESIGNEEEISRLPQVQGMVEAPQAVAEEESQQIHQEDIQGGDQKGMSG